MTKKLQKNKYRVLLRQGLTTKKLVAMKTKSWQVLEQKVGRFDPKKRVPPLIQKFIAGLASSSLDGLLRLMGNLLSSKPS